MQHRPFSRLPINLLRVTRCYYKFHRRRFHVNEPAPELKNAFKAFEVSRPVPRTALDDLLRESNRYQSDSSFTSLKLELRNTTEASLSSDTDVPNQQPYASFYDLEQENASQPPTTGSIVEFYHPETQKFSIGIVLEPAPCIFNGSHNKPLVLDITNELVRVSPIDMSFHALQVFDPKWLDSLQILPHRFDDSFGGRQIALQQLKHFAQSASYLSFKLDGEIERVYCQKAAENEIVPVLIVQVMESIQLAPRIIDQVSCCYRAQLELLYGIHLAITACPRWILEPSARTPSNLVAHESNIRCISRVIYFTNSTINSIAICKLLRAVSHLQLLSNLNKFLNKLVASPPTSCHDAALFFCIWDGAPFKYVIDAMKAAIVFPHPVVMQAIQKLAVFTDSPLPFKPAQIYYFLHNINVYNHPDILLSANVAGRLRENCLQVYRHSEIEVNSGPEIPLKLPDQFPHVRNRRYYRDHVIYGLEEHHAHLSGLAVSLEKKNARNYLINIHIPDPVSRLGPASAYFKWASRNNAITGTLTQGGGRGCGDGDDDGGLYAQATTHLRDQVWFKLQPDAASTRDVTCITLTFAYNIFEPNPFVQMGSNVLVLLDDISRVSLKSLDDTGLAECIAGEEPLLAFRLFKESAKRLSSAPGLDLPISIYPTEDKRTIKFIHSCLKTHSKMRYGEGASELETLLANNKALDSKRCAFFRKELGAFASLMVSAFCVTHNIPVITKSQDLLDRHSTVSDTALIVHKNPLIPDYRALLYAHTLLGRDRAGYASIGSVLVGRHFLQRERHQVLVGNKTRHQSFGLENGRVGIVRPTDQYVDMVNQLQLINHIQAEATRLMRNGGDASVARHYGRLKRHGYNVNGVAKPQVIRDQVTRVEDAATVSQFLNLRYLRHKAMRKVERQLEIIKSQIDGEICYECVIIEEGAKHQELWARAYCTELQIEVSVVTDGESRVPPVGGVVMCYKVLFLDPIGLHLVFLGAME